MAYRIEFDRATARRFRFLTTRQKTTVLDLVDRQLLHEPTAPTRNRKLRRAPIHSKALA